MINEERKKVHPDRTPASIVVIGGGAAGTLAAFAAASHGADVTLLERNDRIGRKIYATGNGRCNITNQKMTDDCYYSSSAQHIPKYYSHFQPEDLLRLFNQFGIFFHDRNGYVYPRTDQASTIAYALEKMLSVRGVSISRMTEVTGLERRRGSDGRFLISGQKSHFTFRKGKTRISDTVPFTIGTDRVILAAGGMAAPKYGSHGDGYRLAAGLGHTVIGPEPALVPLISELPALKSASGVRCHARAELYLGDRRLRSEEGEIQFSENRISGIPVLQLSRLAVEHRATDAEMESHHQSELYLRIDFLPEISDDQWKAEKERRLSALERDPGSLLADLFFGLVNERIGNMILAHNGLQGEKKCRKEDPAFLETLLESLRAFRIPIDGYGSFDQAQTTAGGVALSELTESFESRKVPGLYMAGEMLDADGICGGYNLTWAMISGYLAGLAAAGVVVNETA